MTTRPCNHQANRPLVIGILLLAGLLRLGRLDLIEFKLDEATVARSALAIARQGRLPVLGMTTSLGPANPPLTDYLLALPFALSRDPRLATGFVALLGVAAVAVTYFVARAYFDRRVGLVAAFLFAASPWAVFSARKIWAQNLPLVTLLFVAAVLALVVRRRPWALVGAFAAAGALAGLHLGGLAFFFVLAAVLVLFRRRVQVGPLLAGLGLVALLAAPYLWYDATHGWPNLRALLALGQQPATLDLAALRMASLAIGGYHFEDLAGERHAEFVSRVPDLRWLDVVEMALFWAGLAYLVVRVGRQAVRGRGRLDDDSAARLILVVWFAVPVLLQLRHTAPLYPHYFILLYPVPHLVIGLLLTDVSRLTLHASRVTPPVSRFTFYVSRFMPPTCALLLALLLGWHAYLQQALLSFVDAHDTPGGYGAPVRYALAAAQRAELLLTEAGDAELILLAPGAEPRWDEAAAVFDLLLESPHRAVDGRAALVLPDWPAVYLVVPGAEPGSGTLSHWAEEYPDTVLPVRAGAEAHYRFFAWTAESAVEPPLAAGEERRWANGVQLLGYDWAGEPSPGGKVHLTLYWQVIAPPPEGADYHWFNHLVDGKGNRWGQRDGVGLPTAEWRVGDVALTWLDLEIAPEASPGPYTIRSGMYTYPEVVNVPLVDGAGEFVELGPVGE